MKSKRLWNIVGEIDEGYIAEAAPVEKKSGRKPVLVRWYATAACLVLLFSAGIGIFSIVAEAKEYETAIQFFNDYGMSTDGLTRWEIKAIYQDIVTESFTYSKTAEVIRNSISYGQIGGYVIKQDPLTPEEIKNLWEYKNHPYEYIGSTQGNGCYRLRSEHQGVGLYQYYIEKYDGETLIWSVSVSEFSVNRYSIVSDGVIVYGHDDTLWSTEQGASAWMAKIDSDGNLMWKQKLDGGFDYEFIEIILENADGSYAVIGRGDFRYFCLRQYTRDGKLLHFSKTEIGQYGIRNAARLGDGYIVQLDNYLSPDNTRIVKVDYYGNLTESFSYSGDDVYYFITDMIEFNGKVYLSAYTTPKIVDDVFGQEEIASILNYLFDNGMKEISDEELTPLVQDNYTAMLLVCDSKTGIPQEFYSVKGSLGGKLSVSDTGTLLWEVESIITTFYSPYTSSFTIGGTSYVFRYTFDDSGKLIAQEKTDKFAEFRR